MSKTTRTPAGAALTGLIPDLFRLNGRLLASRLPDARLHVVAGGGHLFLLDEPENAAPAIRAFLDAE